MDIFFEILKKELKKQELNQIDLSEKTGISINTIRGWISKNVIPDSNSIRLIAEVLNVSVDYLLTGDTKRNYSYIDSLPTDIQEVIIDLLQLSEKQREPVIAILTGQIGYWRKIKID